MGGENVKITMLQRVLRMIAPDLCYFCGKIGTSICEYCKYDITYDSLSICFQCSTPSSVGVCAVHNVYISQVVIVGEYETGFKKALEGLKFHNDKFSSVSLAELLALRTPYFPSDVVVVPIPTLRKNIRRRGYDQAHLLACSFAKYKGLKVKNLIERRSSFVQHDTKTRYQREKQIKGSFAIKVGAPLPQAVILVDDIITTGATINEAARVLREAGVDRVFAVAVAHPI